MADDTVGQAKNESGLGVDVHHPPLELLSVAAQSYPSTDEFGSIKPVSPHIRKGPMVRIPQPAIELLEQFANQSGAIDGPGRKDFERGGPLGQFGRKVARLLKAVDADPADIGPRARFNGTTFDENSADFSAVHHQIIRPANLRADAGFRANGIGDRDGKQQRQRAGLECPRRVDERDAAQNARSARRSPGPSHAASPCGLNLGQDHQSVGLRSGHSIPDFIICAGGRIDVFESPSDAFRPERFP